jgi:hypothetical protein
MKVRNRMIICLAIIGIVLCFIVYGIIIPREHQKKAEYIADQKHSITHELESILKYKNEYMGNFSNIAHLFSNLPLNDIPRSFELFPDKFTVEVNYEESIKNIDEEQLDKDLIYNSIAAFALIDNLEGVNYNFTDSTYKFLRSDVEKFVGEDLSSILTVDEWKVKIKDRLENGEYVNVLIYEKTT